ncbi:hypothetical protein CQW23_09827 [Capsicum baccatum]|uniref:Uncharacterized protein n=1 Tax=Capsicum baccatum TaxID=33114 RepID=A0A2G2WY01_CAPBA|nr:hypothetical protein CQW23_09827 [Capsicum baccatum]
MCSEKGKNIKLFGLKITTTITTVMFRKDCRRKIKKANPWTEDEQIAFLKGLKLHGKGNWAKIAKDFFPNITSTQIANHSQKHFMRLDANSNERKHHKKSSVFDIHLEKIEDIEHAIVPLENNQESLHVPIFLPNFNLTERIQAPKVKPVTWVYMYPYH